MVTIKSCRPSTSCYGRIGKTQQITAAMNANIMASLLLELGMEMQSGRPHEELKTDWDSVAYRLHDELAILSSILEVTDNCDDCDSCSVASAILVMSRTSDLYAPQELQESFGKYDMQSMYAKAVTDIGKIVETGNYIPLTRTGAGPFQTIARATQVLDFIRDVRNGLLESGRLVCWSTYVVPFIEDEYIPFALDKRKKVAKIREPMPPFVSPSESIDNMLAEAEKTLSIMQKRHLKIIRD